MTSENINTSRTEREHARRRRCGLKLLHCDQTPSGGRAIGWLAGVALAALASLASAQSCVTPVGSYTAAGIIADLETEGSLAYATGWPYGLEIIDIRDPAAPVLVGTYDGYYSELAVVGTTVYGVYLDTLDIVNVSDPSAPALLGSLTLPDRASCLEVVGGLAFIGQQNQYDNSSPKMWIIDVSAPAAPQLIGEYETMEYNTYVTAISISGAMAYLTTTTDYVGFYCNVEIIDIADPTAPALLGNYIISSNGGGGYAAFLDIEVVGANAYCSYEFWDGFEYGEAGVMVLDVSDPTLPVVLDKYLDTQVMQLEMEGMRAYLTTRRDWQGFDLVIIDSSDPTHLVEIGFYETEASTYALQVVGSYAYVVYDDGLIQVLDISDCSSCDDPCRADFNDDGTVNTQDFIAFLNAWAAGCE